MESYSSLVTYQEFQAAHDKAKFIADAISRHSAGKLYRDALSANLYMRQLNEGIMGFSKMVYSLSGRKTADFTAPDTKIASNFFERLNVQRCMYSLGSGVSFASATDEGDATKESLGASFDDDVMRFGLLSLIHGISFPFWNYDHIDTFAVTEFAPFWDEETGALRAGVRFWQLSPSHKVNAVLYEEDGYTRYVSKDASPSGFIVKEGKRSYKTTYAQTQADGMLEVVEESNYSALPIVPVWGDDLHQSTLVGLKGAIDAYDLVKSGFACDVQECAEIYWLVENYGGMTDEDIQQFFDRLKLKHIASADTQDGGRITPFTQEVPYQARESVLKLLREDMYADFCVLDVHSVAAGDTNDHVQAAYEPMDNKAAEFERHIRRGITDILALQGIEDTPVFQRNRVSNLKEQVEIVLMEAPYLDDETILRKLPNITPDEVQQVLERRDEADMGRIGALAQGEESGEGEEEPEATEDQAGE